MKSKDFRLYRAIIEGGMLMMNYCPQCGTALVQHDIDLRSRMSCPSCQFIDWDNWMNVAVVVVAYTENSEFVMVRMKRQQPGTLSFPQGFREFGESPVQAAQREFIEESGHQVEALQLYDLYVSDPQRLVWIIYTGRLGAGHFHENPETLELLFYSNAAPPPDDMLRGNLTKRLLQELLNTPEDRERNNVPKLLRGKMTSKKAK